VAAVPRDLVLPDKKKNYATACPHLTNSTEYQLPCSVSQEISSRLWKLKVYLPCSKSLVLNRIQSHLNPISTP
jgi:hypothetical protein